MRNGFCNTPNRSNFFSALKWVQKSDPTQTADTSPPTIETGGSPISMCCRSGIHWAMALAANSERLR